MPTSKPRRYRSDFERRLAERFEHCEFEPFRMPYEVHTEHTYTPDFVDEKGMIMWELKGNFRTRDHANKYHHIIPEAEKQGYRFIFVFQNPSTPFPGAKRRRKCGTKQTMAQWATFNKYEWYHYTQVPPELLKRR
jgi:hypothetical protein